MKYGFYLEHPSKRVSTIKVLVTYNGCKYQKSLKMTIPTIYWDKSRQRVDTSVASTTYKEVTLAIIEMANLLDRLAFKMPQVVSTKQFWEIAECERDGRSYDATTPETTQLTAYVNAVYIPRHRYTKSLNRITRFRVLAKLLEDFEEHSRRKWKFSDINQTFYREFQAYCLAKHYRTSYYNSLVKLIKQVVKEAGEIDKYHTNTAYNKNTTLKEVYDSIYLNEDELERIHKLVIDEKFIKALYPESVGVGLHKRIQSFSSARDLFLIGAYTGLRVSDFRRLTSINIREDGMITIVAQKTGQKVVVPIHPVVRAILDNGYDLSKKALSEQKLRLYIKTIGRCAGIDDIVIVRTSQVNGIEVKEVPKWQLIGTHTARRSFATNAYKGGVPTLEIMKITGHTKESTFMRYIRVDEEENAELLAAHPWFNRHNR